MNVPHVPDLQHSLGNKHYGNIIFIGAIAGVAGLLFIMSKKPDTPANPAQPVDLGGGSGGGSGSGWDAVIGGLTDQIDALKDQIAATPVGASLDLEFGYDNGTLFTSSLAGGEAVSFGGTSITSSGKSGSGSASGFGISLGGSGSSSSSKGTSNQYGASNEYAGGSQSTYADKYTAKISGKNLTDQAIAELIDFFKDTGGTYDQRVQAGLDQGEQAQDAGKQLGDFISGLQQGGPVQNVNSQNTANLKPLTGTPRHKSPPYRFKALTTGPYGFPKLAYFEVTKRNTTDHNDAESRFIGWAE